MELDRQPWPDRPDERERRLAPQRIAETRPTPLQNWFIYLSIVVLVCGVIVITALEFGARLGDPLVRVALLIGAIVLLAVTADALVRVWRSAWAWLPVDRGRGLFRFVWAAVLGFVLLAAVGAVLVAITQ